MSDRREGDDCCDEKSPAPPRPPLPLSTPRDDGGDEKSEIQNFGFRSRVLKLRFT